MEEESSGSNDNFKDRYDSDRYCPTNNSDEEDKPSHDHRTKSRKHAPILEEGEDRISTLPDCILLTILSPLHTKEAIKTNVLPKRWTYLWTSVPCLRFTNTFFGNSKVSSADFATAVDLILHRHRAPKLTNFSVEFKFKPDLKPRTDLWVRFATTAKVEQLSLRLSPSNYILPKRYKLPQHLYFNEFVSELHFRSCKIKPNGLIGWSSLKHLYFGYTPLPDDVINKVLLGSPRLESLELHDCFGFYRLDIVSESLKKMVIDSYCEELGIDYPLELEIVSPKIESLESKGCFYNMKKCHIKDLSALVEVRLDFEIPCEYDNEDSGEEEDDRIKDGEIVVREIFESLHQVKKLAVGRWCLTVSYS